MEVIVNKSLIILAALMVSITNLQSMESGPSAAQKSIKSI